MATPLTDPGLPESLPVPHLTNSALINTIE